MVARTRVAEAVSLSLALLACESTPILLYHSVGEPWDGSRWVSSEELRLELLDLLASGYEPITASELDGIEDGTIPSPRQPILITFDDGFQNFHDHAYPVLKELGIKSTMFLISGRVRTSTSAAGAPAYLSWEEVDALKKDGVEMQSHTVTHRRLRGLDDAEIEAELRDSRSEIERQLGVDVTVIAYPFGSESPRIEAIAARAGYRSGHSVESGLGGRFGRQRVSIHHGDGPEAVRAALRPTWWGEVRE
ncbi:MAG: polysaccharide deacetylase family protein [Deltaproteobacteria bacterium]|nr:polysaccharide deacetylase family protein [Deltaproteobacteria bacterium]